MEASVEFEGSKTSCAASPNFINDYPLRIMRGCNMDNRGAKLLSSRVQFNDPGDSGSPAVVVVVAAAAAVVAAAAAYEVKKALT